jgi:hypothetical protein
MSPSAVGIRLVGVTWDNGSTDEQPGAGAAEVPRNLDQRRLTTAARPPRVETPGTSAERRDVEKPAHHRHVFQEMDLLIAVG